MCLLEAMDVDGWTGALLTRGRYDALRKQRSGFGARTLPDLPACLSDSSILKSKGCSSQFGKTDPILGGDEKGEAREVKRKRRWRGRESKSRFFFYILDDFSIAHTLKNIYTILIK